VDGNVLIDFRKSHAVTDGLHSAQISISISHRIVVPAKAQARYLTLPILTQTCSQTLLLLPSPQRFHTRLFVDPDPDHDPDPEQLDRLLISDTASH